MTVYLRNLKKWKSNVGKDGNREEWKQNVSTAVERVVLTIKDLFRLGKFISALEYADKAISIAPDYLLLHAAHACALTLHGGRNSEARAVFLAHRGNTIDGKTWEVVIEEQFAELRRTGCDRPLMDEIEKRFAGIEVPEIVDDAVPSASTKDAAPALLRGSDISSGEILEGQGRLDDALTVYGRCLDECKAKIDKFANGQFNVGAIDDRTAVVSKLADLGMRFLGEGNFNKALESIDCALSATPNSPLLNIRRAHALMFLKRAWTRQRRSICAITPRKWIPSCSARSSSFTISMRCENLASRTR